MIKNAIQRALKGELIRLETTNTNESGDIKDLDVSIKPIFNTARQIEFIIVEGRDITNLKQAEFEKRDMAVQLEKAQKMEAMGTLAGGIAHDFNNILSSIFGYTQLAEMTIDIQVNILSKSMVLADPTQMHQVIMNLLFNIREVLDAE